MSDLVLSLEQEMRQIAASKQYSDYCLHYSAESLRFKLLPEKIKLLSYYLMLKGEFEKLTQAIPDEIFTSTPLGIEEFLAGPAAGVSETLRHAWRKEIVDYFTPGNSYSEIVFTGAAGCVDADTEFFTGTEWKRIADYAEGDKVLQYNPETKDCNLVYPSEYVKKPCDKFWSIGTTLNTMTLSDEHNVVYYKQNRKSRVTDTSNLIREPLSNILAENESCLTNLSQYKIPISCENGVRSSGTDLTDSEIALIIAIQADGSHARKKWRINVKKDRKKARLEKLLNEVGVDYSVNINLNTGFNSYTFYFDYKDLKEFNDEFYQVNVRQAEIILNEVIHWDGCKNSRHGSRYSNGNKKWIDFIQYCCFISGRRSYIQIDSREYKGYDKKNYTVSFSNEPVYYTSMASDRVKNLDIKQLPSTDGFKYCFTVPSSTLVLRKDRRIFITGNTGKSTCANYIMMFILYRVCLLKRPQAVFGIAQEAPIFFMFLNATLDMAKDINLFPFVNVLANCGAFYRAKSSQELHSYRGEKIPFHYIDSDAVIRFRNNISVSTGSAMQHIIGKNIIAAVSDEGNLNSNDGLKIYSEVGMRIESRFKSSSFTFKALISSSTTTDSVVSEYLDSVEEYIGKSVKLCSYARWEVFSSDPYREGHFYLLAGSSVYPSRILDTDLEAEMYLTGDIDLPPMCEIIKVPIEHLASFKIDLEKMVQDIVGRATQTSEVPFPDLTRLEDSTLPPLLNLSCSINSTTRLIDKVTDVYYREGYDGRRFLLRSPKEPRFIAIDKSLNTGSESAVIILHKERHPVENTIVYVVDLLVSISTPDKIDLEALDNFIIDLIYEFNIPVHSLILDQWQNQATIQRFERLSIAKNVFIHSTSRTITPIRILSNLVAQNRVRVGKCKKLKDQMKNISLKKMRNGRTSYKISKRQSVYDLFEVLLNAVFAADAASELYPASVYEISETKTVRKSPDYIEVKKDDILARFGLKIKS